MTEVVEHRLAQVNTTVFILVYLRVACRENGITEQTYYRWRKEYGGLQVDQARRQRQTHFR